MPQPRKILVNVSNKSPLALSNSIAQGTIANFTQGDIEPTELYFFESNGSGGLNALDLTNTTVKFSMVGGAGLPTGTLGGPPLIAYQPSWTWDSGSKKFSAIVSYDNSDVADFLSSNASLSTTLEIRLYFSDGSVRTALQWPVTISASVIEDDSAQPVEVPRYFFQTDEPTSASDGSVWLDPHGQIFSYRESGQWVNIIGGDEQSSSSSTEALPSSASSGSSASSNSSSSSSKSSNSSSSSSEIKLVASGFPTSAVNGVYKSGLPDAAYIKTDGSMYIWTDDSGDPTVWEISTGIYSGISYYKADLGVGPFTNQWQLYGNPGTYVNGTTAAV